MAALLELVGVKPSPQSLDYVANKTQFQLHTLLTEQRHPRTTRLSDVAAKNLPEALAMLFSVDDDIAARLGTLDAAPLRRLSDAVEQALLQHRRIYVYGCGATGRLAKQLESSFWRPFWRAALADGDVRQKLPRPDVADALTGEMTGADRALISSLEGFEDLQLIGARQLADHGVQKGDVVIAVTEGGETSSVIGTILAARAQWRPDEAAAAREQLYFVYNNPDDKLRPFVRSRRVLDEPGITKINLATGPQAIAGSTRMQATTIETFVLAHALEDAVSRYLARFLDGATRARLGFQHGVTLGDRLARFARVLDAVKRAAPSLAKLTALEADTYRAGRFSTYFADRGLITVFIDGTERSPTFRLHPLDTVDEPRRRCWIQVWTPARDRHDAWRKMLGREFRGLDARLYKTPFERDIDDPYLRAAALHSLERAGDQQQERYDFSFSDDNLARRGPDAGDFGLAIAVDEGTALADTRSDFAHFAALFAAHDARLGFIVVGDAHAAAPDGGVPRLPGAIVQLRVGADDDPFHVDQQIALKMALNAHSTAIMARLGKVVGNTMTNVSPSNLKLVGRATYLIQLHVNDVLARPHWIRRYGRRAPISYAEANAVLFDAMRFVADKRDRGSQEAAEVSLSIVRILESLRRGRAVGPDEALEIVEKVGLGRYLAGPITDG